MGFALTPVLKKRGNNYRTLYSCKLNYFKIQNIPSHCYNKCPE